MKKFKPEFEYIKDFWKRKKSSHKYIAKFLYRIKVEKKERRKGLGPCWIFMGKIGKTGYSSATLLRKTNGAHRFSFRIFRGKILKGLHVCHKCDIRKCCNPNHLFLGTPLDNVRDMISKGRQIDPKILSEKTKGKINLGDKNGMRLHPDRRATKENGRHITVKKPGYSNNDGDKHWSRRDPEKMLELRRRVSFKGSKHGQAKLNEEKVLKIKKLFISHPEMTNNEIALRYGVSESGISHIRNNRSWTHVKLEE